MTKDEINILALTESLILWDHLSETGLNNKDEAIKNLYNRKMLSEQEYGWDCPFCDFFRNDKVYSECRKCIWPRNGRISTLRCIEIGPFIEWCDSWNIEQRKQAAQKVLEMLLTIEI